MRCESIDAWLIDARAYQCECACDSDSQCNRFRLLLCQCIVRTRVDSTISNACECMGNKIQNTYLTVNIIAPCGLHQRKQTDGEETNVIRTVIDGSSHKSWTNMPLIGSLAIKILDCFGMMKIPFIISSVVRCDVKIDNESSWSRQHGMGNGVAASSARTPNDHIH